MSHVGQVQECDPSDLPAGKQGSLLLGCSACCAGGSHPSLENLGFTTVRTGGWNLGVGLPHFDAIDFTPGEASLPRFLVDEIRHLGFGSAPSINETH